MDLRSERVETAGADDAIELFFEKGWTDGLPVVPPTAERVERMIAVSGRASDELLGLIPPKASAGTVEKLAVNAVMAGCKPEYFPVVLAAVEAMLAPEFNWNGVATTAHIASPLVIVNGPVRKRIGVNCGWGVFGNGWRANGTIGRAVALIMWNLGGAIPGETCRKTMGHPGKWSYCIGENEEASPWPPFHAERGFKPEQSTVTVFGCEAPHGVRAVGGAKAVLHGITSAYSTIANNNIAYMGEALVVIGPLCADEFKREGWSKQDVRQSIWQQARLPVGVVDEDKTYSEGLEHHFWPPWVNRDDPRALAPMTKRPEDIHVLVAGGYGRSCAICPGWGEFGGFAVTREVRLASGESG